MHSTVKRVLFYLVLAATCYGISVFFVANRTAFIVIFVMGLLIGLSAELLFWRHLYLVCSNRRKQRHV